MVQITWMLLLLCLSLYLCPLQAAEDVDLCKRKPYLLFCRGQESSFDRSQEVDPAPTPESRPRGSGAPLPRPNTRQLDNRLQPQPQRQLQLNRDHDPSYLTRTDKDSLYYPRSRPWTPPAIRYHHKDYKGPIDMRRPNAEDVAREMGELQERRVHDDPLLTNRIPDGQGDSVDGVFDASTTVYPPTNDTDDLDYKAYRLRRARLLRKLKDLDSDQLRQQSHGDYDFDDSTSGYSAYPSYSSAYRQRGYSPYSSYYPSSYYSNGYPSNGYSPSYGYGNPGYLGGGYGQPFNLGIGWGVNVGVLGLPIGVGSGLGVNVG